MCGIVGYTGNGPAASLILDSLELLEYRGYDSAGLALKDSETGETILRKRAGRVQDLRYLCDFGSEGFNCGIGHTRWATHGGVSNDNAHPHRFGKVVLVHNGIIENYLELRDQFLLSDRLKSDTDSEIAAGVMDHFYNKNPRQAIAETVRYLKGTFSLVIMFEDIPDVIYAVRNVSPIVASYTNEGTMLASDVTALGIHAKQYMPVPEMNILELHKDAIRLYDMKGNPQACEFIDIDWDTSRASKGNYPFYMEKEIMEQPETVMKTIKSRIREGHIDLTADGIPDSILAECDSICAIACGTAMHAALTAKNIVQSRLRIKMEVECASEFIYSDPILDERTLAIVISQSGETIDTLTALKYVRSKGVRSIAVINVKGSSIARESDYVIYTDAGPEIAVASTKAFTAQIAAMMLLIGRMAVVRHALKPGEEKSFVENIMKLPEQITSVLDRRRDIHVIARQLLEAKDTFMIGRGLDYSILLEGALKLKEVSYIHTEAYASGELKHGTIALITEDIPVIAMVTQTKLISKELSNIREVKTRGANVILFLREDIDVNEAEFSKVFRLPAASDDFMVIPAVTALQLLAYYVSSDKGLDVDKPRNLAKVVTVE